MIEEIDKLGEKKQREKRPENNVTLSMIIIWILHAVVTYVLIGYTRDSLRSTLYTISQESTAIILSYTCVLLSAIFGFIMYTPIDAITAAIGIIFIWGHHWYS